MGQHPVQLLRELVMMTSFALVLVVVSYGLYQDHHGRGLDRLEARINGILPPIQEPTLLHPSLVAFR